MTTPQAVLETETVFAGKNPIFNRELLTLLRSRKAFVLLAVYLSLSAAVVLFPWPREAATLLLQGAVSREIFSLFALGQTLLMALLVPATLGSAMTLEKEGETLDLLLTTPVSADRILVGKLSSGICYFVLLQLASVPVLLLCFVLGGLSSADILGLYLYILFQILIYGLTAVNCSIYFHRTHIAVILSYVFVGIEALALSFVYGDGLTFVSEGGWLGMTYGSGILLLLLYAAARAGIRRPYSPVRKSIEEENPGEIMGLVIRRDHYPDRLIVPPRRNTLLSDRVNPVLDKEVQAEIYGSGSLFIRLVIQLGLFASVGAFLWVLSASFRPGDLLMGHPEYPYFAFIIGYIMILAPSIAAATFTQEKERHTMESLLLTMIPRSRIVKGKFLAIARVVGALTFLNCWGFVILIVVSSHRFSQITALAMVILTVTTFAITLGMFLSLLCRTTLAATISTYFILFALFIGPVLLETFLTRLFPNIPLRSIDVLTYVSPFLACRLTGGGWTLQFQHLMVHGGLTLALSVLFLAWMSRGMERIVRSHAEMR